MSGEELLQMINERTGEDFQSVPEYIRYLAKACHNLEMPPEVITTELYWFAARLEDISTGKRPALFLFKEIGGK